MGAVQRELKALTDAGIIKRLEKGKQAYYQANPQCTVFPELKSLIMKTAGMGDTLRVALSPLAERVQVAFIYGSIARGDESRGSDVDIFIVGDVTFAEVVEALSPVQQTLNREINPTVYPVDEFRAKQKAGHHFIKSVLEGNKLFLIRDEHDLAKLAS
jgi:predicted nucleotidyltransferase